MRQLTSIVAVNRDGVIGCRNSLPWRIRSDMAFFKATTSNSCVIMGRKTHDSLGRCLPDRYNIVLSHQLQLFDDTSECVLRYGIDEALAEAETAPVRFAETFVIGGSMIYGQFDDLVDRYLITIVDKAVGDADAFFDLNVMASPTWHVSEKVAKTQHDGDEAPYQIYELTACDRDDRVARRQAAVEGVFAKRGSRPKPARRQKSATDTPESMAFGW